jgi:hypothetical protein
MKTSGMGVLKAQDTANETCKQLKIYERDLVNVGNAADNCVNWTNDKLRDLDEHDLEVYKSLPVTRLRRWKTITGEAARADAITAYRIEVHNVIFDVITESLSRRYLDTKHSMMVLLIFIQEPF